VAVGDGLQGADEVADGGFRGAEEATDYRLQGVVDVAGGGLQGAEAAACGG
jgi:hypothetical protein